MTRLNCLYRYFQFTSKDSFVMHKLIINLHFWIDFPVKLGRCSSCMQEWLVFFFLSFILTWRCSAMQSAVLLLNIKGYLFLRLICYFSRITGLAVGPSSPFNYLRGSVLYRANQYPDLSIQSKGGISKILKREASENKFYTTINEYLTRSRGTWAGFWSALFLTAYTLSGREICDDVAYIVQMGLQRSPCLGVLDSIVA